MAVEQGKKDGRDVTARRIFKQDRFFSQWIILSIALIATGSIFGLNILYEHGRTLNREQERLLAQSRVLQENTGQNLIAARNVLVGLRRYLPKGRADQDIIDRLQILSDSMPGIRTLAIIDASGTWLASNRKELIGKNFSYRDYFKAPQQQPDKKMLYIAPPYKSVLGVFTVSVSVIIPGPKGEFAGVAMAGLEPKYFAPLMDSVLYSPDMWLGIAHWEGSVFMMRPDMKEFAGKKYPPGGFFFQHKNSGKEFTVHSGITIITGENRLIVSRTVRPASLNIPTPLVVCASRSRNDVLINWRNDSLKFAGLYGFIVLISISGLYAFQRRQRKFNKRDAEAAYALKQSEERFRSFVENANDIIYSLNPDGIFTYVSPNWTEMLGHNISEVEGHNFEIFVHPDDLAQCRAFLERVIISGEKQSGLEYRVLHKNGTWRWHASNGSVIHDTEKNTVSYIGIARDITERKQSEAVLREKEATLRGMFEAAVESIFLFDKEGKILAVNDAGVMRIGKTVKEILGLCVFDLLPPHLAQTRRAYFQEVVQSGKPCRFEDERQGAWFDNNFYPVLDETGNVERIVLFTREITKLKQNELEIKKYTVELERSNRELQDFAYIASHDLQEPLRKIITFNDILQKKESGNLSDMGKDYMQRMVKSAQRMRDLIESLLAYSCVSTKAREFERVDMNDIISCVINDLEIRINSTGANVSFGKLPVVKADPVQMGQLFQNLIANSLIFRKDGVNPEIKISSLSPAENVWEISVVDNGIGFDEKYLNRIFQPFQRLHGRTEYEGTGMGLAICSKIAHRHGGGLIALSSPGNGATFTLTIRTDYKEQTL